MQDLQKSRQEIDKVDRKIVELFEHRMQLTNEVAQYKLQTGRKVFDKEREAEKLRTLKEMAGNDFNRHGVQELFTQIMSMSRKLQYGLISAQGSELPFQEIERLNVNIGTKVVCFGEKGSYTDQAMEEYFGTDIVSFHEPSFKKVMQAIKDGKAEYGVLPIENTSTGGISDIYDLLIEFDNCIIGEHVVKIEHALLGLSRSALKDIKTVYSHPQPLMQCSKYLESHPELKTVKYISTADSAKKVLDDNDITQGAIASKRAAGYYGLKVLAEAINHEENNSTRFIIISGRKEFIKGSNKISICFELPHETGSLYNMLSHIIYNGLNMTKIESRPLEGRSFEYRFFLDFEGNLKDAGVKNALVGIREEARAFRILGNYGMV